MWHYNATSQQSKTKYDKLNFSDYKAGFGGKFGLQKDRVDKSAVKSYDEESEKIGTNYEKTRPDGMNFYRQCVFVIHFKILLLIESFAL